MSLSPAPTARVAPDRGRWPSIATLVLLAALSWAAVLLWARSSWMMDAMPGQATFVDAASFTGMWLLMMAAMMLPSVTPVVVLFRTMQRGRVARGSRAVPTTAFVGGYLVVWVLAGIGADLAYAAAQVVGDQSRADSSIVPYLEGGIIILAGLYQFSPLKHVCLAHCRSPFHIILHGWHDGRLGASRMGASHGLYCLGCCWGIMAVLFVVGLMNLSWMAVLSILIAGEKLTPWGLAMSRLVGVLFIALGVLMAMQPQLLPAPGLQAPKTMTGMTQAAPPSGARTSSVVAGSSEPGRDLAPISRSPSLHP